MEEKGPRDSSDWVAHGVATARLFGIGMMRSEVTQLCWCYAPAPSPVGPAAAIVGTEADGGREVDLQEFAALPTDRFVALMNTYYALFTSLTPSPAAT